jgi:uncharacterized protein
MHKLSELPLHIVSDGKNQVAFSPSTMTAQLVGRFSPSEGQPVDPKAVHAGERERYQEFIKTAGEGLPERIGPEVGTGRSNPGTNGCLDRLVLNVSHDCNLRCLYCYADGGCYGTPRARMSRSIAFSAIDWVIKAFGGVNLLQFFGGEPFLNPQLILEVCEYFRSLADSKVIKEMPRFAIVTNGTLGNTSFIKLLKRYHMAATISIDGPEEIHDLVRGEGSYAKADAFASLCLETGDIATDFECTWTGLHAARGISVVQLMDFFYERYGIKVLHVVPVSASPGNPLALDGHTIVTEYEEAARHSVRSFAAGRALANSLSHRVMQAFARKEGFAQYCPAGRGVLSVGADGGLYPCFMFTADPLFRICRFGENGEVYDLDFARVSSMIQSWDKRRCEKCQSCWAAPLCTGCMGADYLHARDIAHRSSCDLVKAIAQTVLLEAASLMET